MSVTQCFIPDNKISKISVDSGQELEGKLCRGFCGQVKPLSEFHKESKGVGGKKARCRSCRKKY